MNVTHLECALCGLRHEANTLQNLCITCGKPLLVRYDLAKAAETLTPESLKTREPNLWRYREVLPVVDDANVVTLGEGWTPLFKTDRLAATLPIKLDLYIKDEGQNPTQSFKVRGMTAAISMAKELGVTKLAVPSAGNAAGAMAAYAALAGMEANIFMPADTPRANIVECEQTGANVTLIDGLITDCGKIVGDRKAEMGWFDVSTLKEPYRVEGKKTMGYELFEHFSLGVPPLGGSATGPEPPKGGTLNALPDVILYPTGGGTGLIGMWKAFDEMEQMGWIGSERPRMVSVQSETCAPIVRAFHAGERFADEFENASTVASGLRVPKAIGDFLILDAIRASGGTAVTVTDAELVAAVAEIGALTGIFTAPEGAACLPALRKLIADGSVSEGESVVIFNTGSGVKYLEAFA
ncbi:MAG: threonine synthase [Pyrinomonadaceae bacterium]|nr:threonine synthase [Pyrinomonadaceae bacterium]MBP6212451.1 threonine synthase [Pyrinomonadaceae bacterium]